MWKKYFAVNLMMNLIYAISNTLKLIYIAETYSRCILLNTVCVELIVHFHGYSKNSITLWTVEGQKNPCHRICCVFVIHIQNHTKYVGYSTAYKQQVLEVHFLLLLLWNAFLTNILYITFCTLILKYIYILLTNKFE